MPTRLLANVLPSPGLLTPRQGFDTKNHRGSSSPLSGGQPTDRVPLRVQRNSRASISRPRRGVYTEDRSRGTGHARGDRGTRAGKKRNSESHSACSRFLHFRAHTYRGRACRICVRAGTHVGAPYSEYTQACSFGRREKQIKKF